MKSRFNKYALSFCLILACSAIFAQKRGDVPVPGTPVEPPGLPIDGGISLLLISGVAFGIYELRKKK